MHHGWRAAVWPLSHMPADVCSRHSRAKYSAKPCPTQLMQTEKIAAQLRSVVSQFIGTCRLICASCGHFGQLRAGYSQRPRQGPPFQKRRLDAWHISPAPRSSMARSSSRLWRHRERSVVSLNKGLADMAMTAKDVGLISCSQLPSARDGDSTDLNAAHHNGARTLAQNFYARVRRLRMFWHRWQAIRLTSVMPVETSLPTIRRLRFG
jgi:hypothetical protein